ncbi:Gypsy retrotransposon integrase-like protein 1 [Chionoecetes opilio]|uniref:Gypsy retrotransposon integrase-like protein 1 n=1 Tax=Chionoecetes opilio TaxID=41210 RepID=A0A8J8WNF5_CHIOP|nr:Gypsy retrotransposon integrase-like protein 1 [Chionoecetes opilio]
MDWVLGKVVDQSEYGASLGNTKITDLVFAEDAVIFAESLEVLVMALEALHGEAKPLGLEVSWLKTKVQVAMVRSSKENLRHIQHAVHYARTESHADSVKREEKSGVRILAAKFFIEGDHVCYGQKNSCSNSASPKRLIVTSEEEMRLVLEEAHDKSGHQGIKRTYTVVKKNYYWTSITNDVTDWIKTCPKCQFHTKIKTQAKDLHPIKTGGRWDVLGIDLVGPFTETADKNKYIITMTDLFTKWGGGIPTERQVWTQCCPGHSRHDLHSWSSCQDNY